jgi:predicted dehydrogenase
VGFVARAARDNALTANQLLRANKSVFVEKPFALSASEARSVVDSIVPGRVCAIGLVFLYAPNLARFTGALRGRSARRIHVRWIDRGGEMRHGQKKRYDPSISILVDVFPHVWSLLRLLDEDGAMSVTDITVNAGGRNVTLRLRLGKTEVTAELQREGSERRRALSADFADGEATIDFSDEPGTASIDGIPLDLMEGFRSPLKCELEAFLRAHETGKVHRLADAVRVVEAVRIVDDLMTLYREQQVEGLIQGWYDESPGALADRAYGVREFTLDWLLNRSKQITPVQSGSDEPAQSALAWLRGEAVPEATSDKLSACPELAMIRRRVR